MTQWTVRNHHRFTAQETEFWSKGKNQVLATVTWRSTTFTVETNDGKVPEFVFGKVPGGNDAIDSIDLNNQAGNNNIESCDLYESMDGDNGIEAVKMSARAFEKLEESFYEDGIEAIENAGFSHNDTEFWMWGPIEIYDENEKLVTIIIADENGVVSEYKD
jgi:hypothetical protein